MVERQWQDGDKVEIEMPMRFRLCPLKQNKKLPAAIMRGPLVMVLRANDNPTDMIDITDLGANFEKVRGDYLTWKLKSAPEILLRPYLHFKENENYYMYLSSDLPKGKVIHTDEMNFAERWWEATGRPRFSQVEGAKVNIKFNGKKVGWYGYRFPNAGMADIYIDGKKVHTADQYGPEQYGDFFWKSDALGSGEHELEIRVLGKGNEQSIGEWINICALKL